MQALLDTASEWSLIGGDIAAILEEEAEFEGEKISMDTRFGKVPCLLHRLNVTLVADEGEDLLVASSVLLSSHWEGPPVLGYRGFLERIRFGIDPGDYDCQEQWFFFGRAS